MRDDGGQSTGGYDNDPLSSTCKQDSMRTYAAGQTHNDPRANKPAIATYSLLDRSLRHIKHTGIARTITSNTMLSAEWLSYAVTKGARSLVPARNISTRYR